MTLSTSTAIPSLQYFTVSNRMLSTIFTRFLELIDVFFFCLEVYQRFFLLDFFQCQWFFQYSCQRIFRLCSQSSYHGFYQNFSGVRSGFRSLRIRSKFLPGFLLEFITELLRKVFPICFQRFSLDSFWRSLQNLSKVSSGITLIGFLRDGLSTVSLGRFKYKFFLGFSPESFN